MGPASAALRSSPIGPSRLSLLVRHAPRRSQSSSTRRPKTAIFFPGQGTQKVGMLTPLLESFPGTVNPLLELLDATIPPADSYPPLSQIIASGPGPVLTETENAQPAIMFTSIVILEILRKHFNFDPSRSADFFLGHSLGEFTALIAAGVLTLPDALRLVRTRGEVMRDCARRASVPEMEGGPGETGMVALLIRPKLQESVMQKVTDFIHSETLPNDEFLSIANINSSTQIVLSGHVKAINTCIGHLRQFSGHDPRAIRLNVSAPFHSSIMAPSVRTVKEMMKGMAVNFPPHGEIISNVTARPFESAKEIRELLALQSTATVKWYQSIKYLDDERDVARWIGIGPGRVGKNLVGKEVRGGMSRVIGVEGVDAASLEVAAKLLERSEEEDVE
ncbi:FabD/lysophospholipase-like protein [Ascodesmis nigricans]|uniref:[acyl-carrier-protein] S-malonyltransferase n=1 Tax=Ascodesmis nigricans TaxID=341454 RepID=A0A4S2MKQ9_9PEZI|nr:FabD/lysophospholipase-like protein [Ascodesmis nigricans]